MKDSKNKYGKSVAKLATKTNALLIILVFILAALPLAAKAAEVEVFPSEVKAEVKAETSLNEVQAEIPQSEAVPDEAAPSDEAVPGDEAAPDEAALQNTMQAESQQRRIIGYFCEWPHSVSGQPYTVDDIPWGKVTHINYAYAGVGTDNRIKLNDVAAAIQQVYPGQDTSLPYRGNFNLLNTYKQQYPDTKTLISIGEWKLYDNFTHVTAQQASMDTFADSVVDFLRQYDFDGVDMDFRYPGYDDVTHIGRSATFRVFDSYSNYPYEGFLQLIQTLREKLDVAGEEDGKHYLLTMVAPASARLLSNMGLGEYTQYLDYLSIATFDFDYSNSHTGPNSALYADSRNPKEAGLALPVQNIDWVYKYFRGALSAEKINIGIPYHTRGWKNVTPGAYPGGLYGSVSPAGSGADGVNGIWNSPPLPSGANPLYHVKNLLADPMLGYELFWDDVTKTSYAWNETDKVFLNFEEENSMLEKIEYVIDNGIGGFMVWDLSGDYAYDEVSDVYVPGDTLTTLVHTMFEAAPPLVPEADFLPASGMLADFDYSLTLESSYFPFIQYRLFIDNNTGASIPGGFTLEFDIPSSAVLMRPWGGEIVSWQDNGIFTHYVLEMPYYVTIGNGARFMLEGMADLCFSGEFRNLQINGRYSSQKYNFPPELSGIIDSQIFIGDPFNAMAGVSAYDVNDGDLTNAVIVSGMVDNNTLGSYLLTYNVTDSHNNTATATRTVTVLSGPVISGAGNVQHLYNTVFDPLAGVTAHDIIDGDLTAHIVVNGSVNIAVADTYNLTYTVTNSNNVTTTVTRIVTVFYPPWNPNQIYSGGECVNYQGNNYQAKWWTQGEIPGSGTSIVSPWVII